MRILSLTYEYPPIGGGGGVVAAALNAALVADGHSVDVVTSAMRGLPRSEMVNGVHVHRAPCWRRTRHYSTAAELATTLFPAYERASELISAHAPDLIHTHFVVPSGIVARALSKRFGIPYILTAHGSDIPGYNPDRFNVLHQLLTPVWRRIVRGAAAVTSPSQFLAALLRRHMDVPVCVVPNGYTHDRPPVRAKRNLVLVVARLFPRKGVQHFIDSVAELDAGWDFVIAGDGPSLPDLKLRARRRGARVQFAGFLDRASLRALYEEARILVFPSIRENFPMVLLEAMDAGCAVITTDAEGCAEVVGDAGIVVARGEPGPIRAALLDLMHHPERCETLSQLALERVQQFRWPRIAAQYQSLFESVLRRTAAPALPLERQALP